MRTSPALVAVGNSHEGPPSPVDEGIRSLVRIVTRVKVDKAMGPFAPGSASEEVWWMQKWTARYLLVRMPIPDHHAIRLSPREQEIVRMVAKGHPNKVIADVLNISSWTVCTHLRRIFAKLGVGSRAAMVAQLLQIGALTADHHIVPRER